MEELNIDEIKAQVAQLEAIRQTAWRSYSVFCWIATIGCVAALIVNACIFGLWMLACASMAFAIGIGGVVLTRYEVNARCAIAEQRPIPAASGALFKALLYGVLAFGLCSGVSITIYSMMPSMQYDTPMYPINPVTTPQPAPATTTPKAVEPTPAPVQTPAPAPTPAPVQPQTPVAPAPIEVPEPPAEVLPMKSTAKPVVFQWQTRPCAGGLEITGATNDDGSPIQGTLRIPAEIDGTPVKAVAANAFEGATYIAQVLIEEGVTTIGANAFARCSNLYAARVPKSVTTMGKNTFENCTGLTIVRLEANITSLPEGTFYNCGSIRQLELPQTLTTIEARSISASLGTAVQMPASVKTLHPKCFDGAHMTVFFPGEPPTVLGKTDVADNTALTSSAIRPSICVMTAQRDLWEAKVKLPERTWFGLSVGYIAHKNFLTVSSIPAHYASLPVLDCEKYNDTSKHATSNHVTWYYNPYSDGVMIVRATSANAQQPLSGAINVPAVLNGLPVRGLAAELFRNQKWITQVVLPEGLERIGNSAFRSCPALTAINLPQSVREMGYFTLAECPALETVEMRATAKRLPSGFLYGSKKVKTLVVSEGVEVLNASALAGAALQQLYLPKSLKYLEDQSLVDHRNAKIFFMGPPPVVNSVYDDGDPDALFLSPFSTFGTSTGAGYIYPVAEAKAWRAAMKNATKWYGVSMRAEYNIISPSIVAPAPQATPPTAANTPSAATATGILSEVVDNNLSIVYENANGGVRIVDVVSLDGSNASGSLFVPQTLGGKQVVAIADKAFEDKALTEVILPEGLKTIGVSAFLSCLSLENVVMPDTVTEIGYSAFASCTKLKTVRLSKSLKQLPNNLFFSCGELTAVEIPDGVTTLGVRIFNGCSSIKTLEIPASVTRVGEECFDGLSSVEKIYFQGKPPRAPEEKSSFDRLFGFIAPIHLRYLTINPQYANAWRAELKDGKWHDLPVRDTNGKAIQ